MRLERLGLPSLRPEGVGPSLWVLRGNYRESEAVEGIPSDVGMCPHLYPSLTLADNSTPLRLPPHATHVYCSVQLAAIIGRPVYRASESEALDAIEGVAPAIAVRDGSLGEPLREPSAYELRAAYVLGCSGDGFFRLGKPNPPGGGRDIRGREMILRADGFGRMRCSAADYRRGFAAMISMVSRATTLMPGDVLSLGPAGRELVLPADSTPQARGAKRLCCSIEGFGGFEVDVLDERDAARRDAELR
jgi:2-keto-4-pentenoate hydratase/2-oxohepta-3-ene-1,7-dioic acid hydratase in catechol pathway